MQATILYIFQFKTHGNLPFIMSLNTIIPKKATGMPVASIAYWFFLWYGYYQIRIFINDACDFVVRTLIMYFNYKILRIVTNQY